MKAVLQNIKTGSISVEEIPPPVKRAGHVMVQNHYSLVSAGTEKAVMEFSSAGYLSKAKKRPDLFRKVLNKARNDGFYQTYKVVRELIEQRIPLGYSSAGTIINVGEAIDDLQVGQRVACAGLFSATHSEIVSVPRNLVAPIPEGVEDAEAAFVTIGAIAMQGIRLADLALSENVVIYGLGLVGMVAAQMALAAGCRVLGVDIDEEKLKRARKMGIEAVLAGAGLSLHVARFTRGFGADKAILCAATRSNEPTEVMPTIVRQKGLVVVVGDVKLDLPRREYYEKEIELRMSRSYGPGRYDTSYEEHGIDYPYAYVRWTENRNMEATLDLMSRRRIDVSQLISHQFDIEEGARAYDLIAGKISQPFLGILLRYRASAHQNPEAAQSVNYTPLKRSTARPEVRLGIIGAGNFGKAFLLPAFHRQPGTRFVGICTAAGVSAAGLARKYGMQFATADPDAIFTHKDIDAVVIATRHDTHVDYVQRGLKSGKAVYVEKPLATRLDDLDCLQKTFEEIRRAGADPFLMVGYNRRFSPLARTLKDGLKNIRDPISIIYRVNAGYVPATEWVNDPTQGAGRIIGECCHFIDLISFLVGEPVVAISGSAVKKDGRPLSEVVSINLEYPGGSIATVHYFANGSPSMPKEYIEVYAGGACAVLNNFRHLKLFGFRGKGRTRLLNQDKGFEEQARTFVEFVRDGRPMPIAIADLVNTTRASILAERCLTADGGRIELRQMASDKTG